jgi:hypothetical protein
MHQYRVEIAPENEQFTENNAATAITAVDLPAVFSQETVAVARAQYVSKETPLTFTDGWSAIAQDTIRLPTFVDGYNRTFLRPEASSALVSLDEDKVPLLASWQKGLGRVVAIPFPLAGDQASIVRQWNQYGAFVRTIVQWVRRPQAPAGLSVTAEQIGNTAQIVLRYSPEWEREVGIKAPQAVIASSQSKDPQETAWSRVGPGLFTLTRELLPGEIIHGATKVDEYTIPFGPLTNPRSPEYDFDPEQYRALKQLSRISGGKERISLDGIWDNVDEFSWHSLQSWCIGLALVLLLLEVLLSRLNRHSVREVVMARAEVPEGGLWVRYRTWIVAQRRTNVRSKAGRKKLTYETVHQSEPGIAPTESLPLNRSEKEKMISAFEKAKRRGV